ncbi:Nif3-like dinuclear metal center hexameric protein [Clostridioides sp. GD02404]|uniref:Nif3-like dinuclear metal center hexameric protein n=1 Tax=Clostridioides sp. GD02404 TaxID=3054354 RepID=UPI0038B101B5
MVIIKAIEIYNKLALEFDIKNIDDDWSFMNFDNDFITPEFKTKYIGLVLDNAKEINKVYTTTFPDKYIIKQIIDKDEKDVLIFSHHAMEYIASDEGFPFHDIPLSYMEEMKNRRISFYVLHSPLDNYSEYSTSVSFAKALGLEIVEPFCKYDDKIKVGVICKTSLKSIEETKELVKKTVGHDVKLYDYGESGLKDGLVAIAAGGGSYPFVASEVAELGINLYITGFTKPLKHFEPALEFHRIAKDNLINVIGATHYSTEKFACMSMVNYFKKLGIEAEFLEGKNYLEDL